MVYDAFKDCIASEPVASEAEKRFLTDLYSYMKKRDSPIERIPNLGFKQSNDESSAFGYFEGFKH